MNNKLPPLNSLRAYECAARHMSFTRASQELNVTPAAISQQVKLLENHLGKPLFTRLTRKLALTDVGKALLPEVTESFARIHTAVSRVSSLPALERLNVRLGPSLAAHWLAGRLNSFRAQWPDIELHLRHSNELVNFDREDIDLAISYGDGHWPGVSASKLMELDYFPVCSPKLLGSEFSQANAALLLNHTLLHDANYERWERWLSVAQLNEINARRGILIDDTNVLIKAALDGQGIALGSSIFVQQYLRSGQLIRPFEASWTDEQAYYIVCPDHHLGRPAVQAFKAWLSNEALNTQRQRRQP